MMICAFQPRQICLHRSGVIFMRTFSSNPLNNVNVCKRRCILYNIENRTVPYAEAWAWQQALLRERLSWQRSSNQSESWDALILLEHASVYTLGRGSTIDNIKFDPTSKSCSSELYRVERGGEVTWHGPGQLVAYPILDLNYHKKDLHWYLRSLEEVIIRVLNRHGINGTRDSENTGVWVGNKKYAALGLNASRWITTHGFSLNVCPDMNAFKNIIPCGIVGKDVGSLFENISVICLNDVRKQILEEFCTVFNVYLETGDERYIPQLSTAEKGMLHKIS